MSRNRQTSREPPRGAQRSAGRTDGPALALSGCMNRFRVVSLVMSLLLCAQIASAKSISVGDQIHFIASTGTLGGGAFTVDDVTDAAVQDFLSFCVQLSQH